MKELVHAHFDKLLLTFLFLCVLGTTILLIVTGQDQADIAWARETASAVIGALVGLVTGVALTRHKGNDKGEPNV